MKCKMVAVNKADSLELIVVRSEFGSGMLGMKLFDVAQFVPRTGSIYCCDGWPR